MSDKEEYILITRIEKFLERLRRHILGEHVPLITRYANSGDPLGFKDRLTLEYKEIHEGDTWGKTWESAWFEFKAEVPAHWKGKKIVAQIDLMGEGLVFSNDGEPLQGLCSGSVFDPQYRRDRFVISEACQGGEKVELWVEGAANSLGGVDRVMDPAPDDPNRDGYYRGSLHRARLCIFEEDVWDLYRDADLLYELTQALPKQGVRRARIIRCVQEAINAYGEDPSRAKAARDCLAPELQKEASASDLKIAAVGHAHIDTGWLWPVRESIRKCARTFSTQLRMIDKYPDYIFGASQAQHYLFVKQYYPGLYERIKEAVKKGQWEIQGGMWVEADCNICSGESLVRQILHGKNFFKDEFDVDVDNLWLPDVFGYSAALPQILQKSGIRFFLTQKISWSQYNTFPHHSFIWRGIDGSEVITHFPPENNYNGRMDPKELVAAEERFAERDRIDEFMSLFGIGDGGGGPDEVQIDRAKREANLESCPRVAFDTAKNFFARLETQKDKLKTWSGELYLELHRGTLTTQALVKRLNRKLEQGFRALEFLWSTQAHGDYPSMDLDEMWKTLLINQFHDIIPGSSIAEVYRTTHMEYEALQQRKQELMCHYAQKFLKSDDNKVTLFNCLSTPYRRAFGLSKKWKDHDFKDEAGNTYPTQFEDDTTWVCADVPALSFLTLEAVEKGESESSKNRQDKLLENDHVRYTFDHQGLLVSAFDKKAEREFLNSAGKGNLLSLYIDRPNNWDAWDVDVFYEEQLQENAKLQECSPLSCGPVRQGLSFVWQIGESKVWQNVTLDNNSARLDFETQVDWKEKHKMLRVSFDTAVVSDVARFDIQYGHMTRPTHRNTSWDVARFESVAHRFVDLSDEDGGVALLNDCKYGHKVHDQVIDLNLLRSPTYPDPDADIGEHEFTYSLLPHAGRLIDSPVIPEAEQLNQGITCFETFASNATHLPVSLESEGISLEVVKKAEKEDAWVLRLVECHGRHSTGILSLFNEKDILAECDIMECGAEPLATENGKVKIAMKPFEIRTYLVKS